MDEQKAIISYWGVNLESEVISNKSDTLAVILPGIGYTVDRPLLDYSKKLALELGYDVLQIEYGFQAARKILDRENEFKYVKEESIKIFKNALKNDYKKIAFISKSIGTIVHTILCNEAKGYEIKSIYLTPVNETLKVGIKENSLVISGTSDPLINEETIEIIRKINDVNLMEIKNGDHSLNIKGSVLESIEVLNKVIRAEKDYLKSIICQ
jgi:predicted alpha/beta-hydrolase family hydrolase